MDYKLTEPTLRKPLGVLLMLLIIAVWLAVVLIAAPFVLMLVWPLQALLFAIAGVAWIFPLKPLLRWMETGAWRE
jgi:Protein of unknown function (DUF2842)